MKHPLKLLTLCFSCIALSNICFADTSQHLTTIVDAKRSVKVTPKYPVSMAKLGIEGWTKASYIVEADGTVSNIIITDSSGQKSFEKESIKAIKTWKFTPALENGKPIQQCHNDVQMDYSMNDSDAGVSRRFLGKYKKAKKAITDQKFESVDEILRDLENFKQRRLAEQVHLKLLQADYAKIMGNKDLQLSYLSGISLATKKIISPEQKLSILYRKFILKAQLNHYSSAIKTYEKLKKLDLAKPYLPQLTKFITNIESHINSQKNIAVQANIHKNDYWYHSLARNEFSLTDIQGSLNKLDVRCANKRHVYTVEENNAWKIPASWQECSLYIYGDDNTSFTLIEHPITPQEVAVLN